MKRFFTLLALVALVVNVSFGQFWTEDFETDGNGSRYITSTPEFTDGSGDFFLRTDGSNVSSYDVTGFGGSFFFAAMDIDGEGAENTQTLTFDDIDISGKTDINFSILLAEDAPSDANQDWDADTYLKIQYDIDNSGTFTNLIWVAAEGGTNSQPKIDTDFDGLGDGVSMSSAFSTFSGSLAGIGSTVDIKITFEVLDAGDEDIAIDNLMLSEGALEVPLAIGSVSRDIVSPTAAEDLVITCEITGGAAPYSASVGYKVDGGTENVVPMTLVSGDTYTATIPAQVDGARVEYGVLVADAALTPLLSQSTGIFWGTTPIATLSALDADKAILYKNYTARITAVATSASGTFSATSLDVFMQDATAGIDVYKGGTVVDIVVGNSYTVVGKVDQYRGKTEITPSAASDVIDNGVGTAVEAMEVTFATLLANPEDYDGKLVKVLNVDTIPTPGDWQTDGSDAYLGCTDDGGTSVLTVFIDKDGDIDGTPVPKLPVHLTGIFSQNDSSSPFDEGYRLVLRSLADFEAPVVIVDELVISDVARDIMVPSATEALVITCDIRGGVAPYNANLGYKVDGGEENVVPLTLISGDTTYTAIIPAQADGARVEYGIAMVDGALTVLASQSTGLFWGTTPIETLGEMDADNAILYKNYMARVTAVATSASGTFAATYLDVFLQDATGGIDVYSRDVVMDVVVGNSYTVVGKVDQYNGKLEITPAEESDVVDNGAGTAVVAMEVTFATLLANPEDYDGTLVTVMDVDTITNPGSWPAESVSVNLSCTDDGGTSVVVVRIDGDTDIDGTPAPELPVMITGIFSQFDSSKPYDSGYQILPRSLADIVSTTALKQAKSVNAKIYTSGSTLHINSDVMAKASLYNIAGQVIKIMQVEPGRNEFSVNRGGIYLVKLNDMVEKVVIR